MSQKHEDTESRTMFEIHKDITNIAKDLEKFITEGNLSVLDNDVNTKKQ